MACRCGAPACNLKQHPATRRTVVPHVCDGCGTEWASVISAALCCDPAAPGPAD